MTLLTPITNRSGTDAGWYHLVPKGEFPHPESGLMQVLDDEAMSAMLNRFRADTAAPNFAGLLIDQEHWSYEPPLSSEAMGWLRELQNRADGLWGRIEWTDLGNQALAAKRYKFASPVWSPRDVQRLGNKRVRPLRLDSAGLTNSPNLRGMVPLTNRAGAEPADKPTATKEESRYMKTVATALGLSAEASEEAVLAGVTALLNRAKTAEGALDPLKTELTTLKGELNKQREARVDEDLKPLANRAKPEVIASLRKSLLADRDAALPVLQTVLAGLTAKGAGTPLTNRGKAGNPDTNPGAADAEADETRANEQESLIQEIRLANRCSYREAAGLARRRKPELFASAE